VTVERKSRFVQMDLLQSWDAQTVRKAIEKRFKRMEEPLRMSITFDQGKENCEHKKLSEHLEMTVYFCLPHSPWEMGTCENTNYLIRDMLYPVNDFRQLTQREVSKIARLLNERPRKHLTLGHLVRYSLNCARNYRVPNKKRFSWKWNWIISPKI
jgi:IS30 family transposase